MNAKLEKAITDAVNWMDARIAFLKQAGRLCDEDERCRSALLEAWDEAKAEERAKVPSYATLEEAMAAIRSDPWCPRDVPDETVKRWAEGFVNAR